LFEPVPVPVVEARVEAGIVEMHSTQLRTPAGLLLVAALDLGVVGGVAAGVV
jgi:hypothetical protein